MNKENKKNKKSLIALIVIAVAVVLAVIITTIALSVGKSGNQPPAIDPNNPTVPDDPSDPNEPNDPAKPDDPAVPDDPTDPSEPDDPTSGQVKYGSPLLSYTVGQEFNIEEMVWSDTLKWYSTHNGTDFKAEKGAVVSAIYGGKVEKVAYTTQNGYTITIKQTDGNTAEYMSLSSETLVEEGDSVSVGTQIGYVSDSMSNEQNDGAHLHLELTDSEGNWVDPMSYLPAPTDK